MTRSRLHPAKSPLLSLATGKLLEMPAASRRIDEASARPIRFDDPRQLSESGAVIDQAVSVSFAARAAIKG